MNEVVVRNVLVVDDEPDICELLELTLTKMKLTTVSAYDLHSAKKALNNKNFCLCLTDMHLPDGDGIELVNYIQQTQPGLPVAVITAFGNVEGAVNTLKAGAFDYVSKPINLNLLKELVATALNMHPDTATISPEEMVGTSIAIQQLRKDITKLARSQAPVFIHGESGVGKELVANLIHKQGPRNNGPFVPVNCGAIPSELMESEFFGHKKGSFTGAFHDHPGLFQAAQGGTLFLDEIAELPLHMQVKLLRAIQEKAVKPIGSNQEITVDVRIVSASHKNLLKEIQEDRFRQDLYYRINVIELKVPSLKEHLEDIPLLVTNILTKLTKKHSTPSITPQALKKLSAYSFPGNVRELENILERAITLCEKGEITEDDLHLPERVPYHWPILDESKQTMPPSEDLDNYLENKEKQLILDVLEKTKWNRTAAAKMLGISFRALRYRLKKLGIE